MAFNIEVVEIDPWYIKLCCWFANLFGKYKLFTAIALDVADILFGNIPLLNTIWDIMTFGVLFIILKRKYLAFFALGELIFPGIGFWSKEIDAFVPSATILVLVDNYMAKHKVKPRAFHKEFVIKKRR